MHNHLAKVVFFFFFGDSLLFGFLQLLIRISSFIKAEAYKSINVGDYDASQFNSIVCTPEWNVLKNKDSVLRLSLDSSQAVKKNAKSLE